MMVLIFDSDPLRYRTWNVAFRLSITMHDWCKRITENDEYLWIGIVQFVLFYDHSNDTMHN